MPDAPESPKSPPPERTPLASSRKKAEKTKADPLQVGRSLKGLGSGKSIEELVLAKVVDITISTAKPQVEVRSERDIKEANAAAQRAYRLLILRSVVGVVSACSLICMWIAAVPGYPPETVKWATSVLTAVVSGGLGILVGGKVLNAD